MRRLSVTVALVAVTGLSGCGDDSKETAATTTVPPTTAAPATTLLTGNDEAGTPFCGLAKTYNEKSNAILASAGDPAKLRVAATDAESAIRRAKDVAPASIKDDATRVATTAAEVLSGLNKTGYDLAKTPEVTKLQEPAFQKSFGAVYAYARAHCGVV